MFSIKVLPLIQRCIQRQTRLIHISAVHQNDVKIEKSVNKVTLIGRTGSDPQKRGSEEHPVVTFSVATHNNYQYDSGDVLQRTDWHRISVFRPGLRESVQNYLKKGQRVYVSGRISYGEIKSESGDIRTTSNIIADEVIFLHSANNTDTSNNS